MGFLQNLIERNAAVWHAAKTHPFLHGLVDSTLPHDPFLHYLHQDAWFLRENAKVLAVAASRAPSLAAAALLSESIAAVTLAERDRHRRFAEALGSPIDSDRLVPAPTAYAYVSHLRSVALDGSFAEILAALQPCPCLYRDFGLHFRDRRPADPVYRDWLAAYQDPALNSRVDAQDALFDEVMAEAGPALRDRAARAFAISIRYEHAFWDMAMARQDWDVPIPETVAG